MSGAFSAQYIAAWREKYGGAAGLDEIIERDRRLPPLNHNYTRKKRITMTNAEAFHKAVDQIRDGEHQ